MKISLEQDKLSEVLLIFPPYWCPSHPYLSIPCIQSYLKLEGIASDVYDLNIKLFNYFISNTFIENILTQYNHKFNSNEIIILNKLIKKVEGCKNELNSSQTFINGKKYSENKRILDFVYDIISRISNFKINRNRLKYFEKIDYKNIDDAMENIENDLIYQSYKKLIDIDSLNNIRLIGISVICEDQLIPSLFLCKFLKSHLKNIDIFLGGSYLSKLIKEVSIIKPIFNYCESIIVDEGEKAVVELAKHIIYGDKIECNNIIFKEDYTQNNKKKVNVNYCDIEDLPIPCFDGFLNENYLSPVKILPYYISRKCYWNKCAFCQHDEGYSNKSKVKSFEKIRQELVIYQNQYKVDVIHFIDSAIHPQNIRKICKIIKEEKLKIKWYCYIRAETSFDLELLNEMKLCGCIYVNIGIESFSDKVLKAMNKGMKMQNITNIILNTDKAGIWAHLFLINNFPTETKEDKYESILYLNSMREYIHSISMGRFLLMRNTEIINNPSKFNILKIHENNTFSSFYDYEKSVGDNFDDTQAMVSLLYNLVPTSKLFNEKLAYRDHLPALLSLEELVLNKQRIINFIDEIEETCIRYFICKYIKLTNNEKEILIFIPKLYKIFRINNTIMNVVQKFSNVTFDKIEFIDCCYKANIKQEIINEFWEFGIKNKIIYR